MKSPVFKTFFPLISLMLLMALGSGCNHVTGSNPNNADPTDPTIPGTDDPKNPNGTDDPVNPVQAKYARDYFGEWIRMDTGDIWYISGNTITINNAVTSKTPTLTRQTGADGKPGRVIKVEESGSEDYFLFASRIANATLTGRVAFVLEQELLKNMSSRQAGGNLGKIPPLFVDNPFQPTEPPVKIDPPSEGGDIEIPDQIRGDKIVIHIEEPKAPGITIPPPPGGGNDIGLIPITDGVNLKITINPADTKTDVSMLYADGTPQDFILEMENIGNARCLSPTYTLEYDSDLILTDKSGTPGRVQTLDPGTKRSIPLQVSCKPIQYAREEKGIKVKINDEISRKTWDDSVSIGYNLDKTPFRIKSELPVQGIIITPTDNAIYFKTEGPSRNNYTYSIDLPWSTADYLVAFSGADTMTEGAYSLATGNTLPGSDFGSFRDIANYEPNNTEPEAHLIQSNDAIMAYLHPGDIDFYRVSLGNTVPEIRLISLENYAIQDTLNRDGAANPGESIYLDLLLKNHSSPRSLTVALTTDSPYVTINKGSAGTSSAIDKDYYASLTYTYSSPKASNVIQLYQNNISNALQFTIHEDCPLNIDIPLTLTLQDNQGISTVETVWIRVTDPDTSIAIQGSAVWSESTGGTADGVINPGDRFDLQITLKNSGTDTVSGLTPKLSLSGNGSEVTLNSGVLAPVTLAAGATTILKFSGTVSAACPTGVPIAFSLILTDSKSRTWRETPTPLVVAISALKGLKAETLTNDSIKISWNSLDHVDHYRLLYSTTDSDGSFDLVADIPQETNTYTHTGLSADTLYYYQAVAVNNNVEGSKAPPVSAKTMMPPLRFNAWTEGTLASGEVHYYRFPVKNGISYKVRWQSTNSGGNSNGKTASIKVSAYPETGSAWFTDQTNGNSSTSYTAGANTFSILRVSGSSPGTYGVQIFSGEQAISAFSFTGSPAGTINEADKSITALVSSEANLTSLTPTLSIAGASYEPTGPQDFTGPREYTVTMGDGSKQVYTVTVGTYSPLRFNKELIGPIPS